MKGEGKGEIWRRREGGGCVGCGGLNFSFTRPATARRGGGADGALANRAVGRAIAWRYEVPRNLGGLGESYVVASLSPALLCKDIHHRPHQRLRGYTFGTDIFSVVRAVQAGSGKVFHKTCTRKSGHDWCFPCEPSEILPSPILQELYILAFFPARSAEDKGREFFSQRKQQKVSGDGGPLLSGYPFGYGAGEFLLLSSFPVHPTAQEQLFRVAPSMEGGVRGELCKCGGERAREGRGGQKKQQQVRGTHGAAPKLRGPRPPSPSTTATPVQVAGHARGTYGFTPYPVVESPGAFWRKISGGV